MVPRHRSRNRAGRRRLRARLERHRRVPRKHRRPSDQRAHFQDHRRSACQTLGGHNLDDPGGGERFACQECVDHPAKVAQPNNNAGWKSGRIDRGPAQDGTSRLRNLCRDCAHSGRCGPRAVLRKPGCASACGIPMNMCVSGRSVCSPIPGRSISPMDAAPCVLRRSRHRTCLRISPASHGKILPALCGSRLLPLCNGCRWPNARHSPPRCSRGAKMRMTTIFRSSSGMGSRHSVNTIQRPSCDSRPTPLGPRCAVSSPGGWPRIWKKIQLRSMTSSL